MFQWTLLLFLSTPLYAIRLGRAINDDNYPERLWETDRAIPFTFDTVFPDENRPALRDILREIQSRTCLSFTEVPITSLTRKSTTTIVFTNGTECQSWRVGKNNELVRYTVAFNDGCMKIVNYYELLFYTIGIQSPHQRYDRDEYVTLLENNTKPDFLDMFDKYSPEESKSYGVPYDFDSLLHVIPEFGSIDGMKPTILAKDHLYQYTMGRNIYAPSHADYLEINRLFKCLDKCEAEKTACENGGYVNPHNCSECSCPRGFTGRLCTELDYNEATHKGCGGYIDVTDSWKELTIQRQANENNISCYWFLNAPKGRNIEIKLVTIAPENERCTPFTKTWLEIRSGNFIPGGYKFFCNKQLPKDPIRTNENFVVLTLSQDYSDPTTFTLLHRSVLDEKHNES